MGTQSLVINLGSGDLHRGFPQVVAQLRTAGYCLPEQFVGSLPPAPDLAELYAKWRLVYQGHGSFNQVFRERPSVTVSEEVEIESSGITHVSCIDFQDLCSELHRCMNNWLASGGFLNIELQLRSIIDPTEALQVIIETDDELLRRLPWQRWNLVGDFPLAETSVSYLEYKRNLAAKVPVGLRQVRILMVLGHSLDMAKSRSILSGMDVEVVYLVNPTKAELITQLSHPVGWDLLFFDDDGDNTDQRMTIPELESTLKAALDNGLQLAVFNSRSGLASVGIQIPAVVVMREALPSQIADTFLEHFFSAFAGEELSLYLAVQQARRKLQGVEDEFPGASWLPMICVNPAVKLPLWSHLGRHTQGVSADHRSAMRSSPLNLNCA
jgi:hypothetical protein